MVSVTGGTEEDIIARIRKAQQAFACLRAVWKATSLSLKTKIRIFNSNVKSVLLYGSETWRLTKTLLSKVQTFVNKYLLAKCHHKRRPVGKNWTGRCGNHDKTKKVEMDWPYFEEVWKAILD